MGIDYLRCTQKKHPKFNISTFVNTRLRKETTDGEILGYGISGYDTGYKLKYGQVFTHSTEQRMGVMYQVSGVGLNEMRLSGIDIEKMIIPFLCKTQVKFTRIDYAWDTDNPEITPHALYEYLQLVNTGSREFSLIRSHKPRKNDDKQYKNAADTVYLGSRNSGRVLRVYDKAKEQGLSDGTTWTRIEVELRKERANAVAYGSLKTPINELAASQVLEMNDWTGLSWMKEVIGENYHKTHLPKPMPDANLYITKTLIPYMSKHLWELHNETISLIIDKLIIPFVKYNKGKMSMNDKSKLFDIGKNIYKD